MDLPVEYLSTYSAILEEGSFEGAARRLHVTPSAVSQRVRALEQRVGSVLLQRTRPVATTEAGATILRLAHQIGRLADDAERELSGAGSGSSRVAIVVNADSLATWFVPALARAARESGAHFELIRADETVSVERLRRGDAMAALTASREPVAGCTSTRIGVHRYLAVASPDFMARHFSAGVTADALRTAPVLEFDRKDAFQQRFIRRISRSTIEPPRHYVPSSTEFALAIELGMGWGMLPTQQCRSALRDGRLIALRPGTTIDLPMYWQRWKLDSPVLDTITDVILEEGAVALG